MAYAALLHNLVCGVPGFDFPVDSDVRIGDGTVPDIMIAFPVSHKIAAVFAEQIADLLFIFSHIQPPDRFFRQRKKP